MPCVVFLGPPGSGKGTQAPALARELGIPHLSTGDLLRAAVAAGTPLGRAADVHIRAGRLVPDELVLHLLEERLGRPDARAGCLLDGYPRNLAQARALEPIVRVDRVLAFDLPAEELTRRLAGRRICPRCASVYNVVTAPPKARDRCDNDGESLVQRPDDRPEAVGERLRAYVELTAPLFEHYRTRGLLSTIDASGPPARVAARLREAVADLATSGPVPGAPASARRARPRV